PPSLPFHFSKLPEPASGEVYVMNQHRVGSCGFDVFAPAEALPSLAELLVSATREVAGAACGWTAFDLCRLEAGIPRFGVDIDEANFPQECGIEAKAVSYNKGCYIGQEVLNRIHTIGHVNRRLCGLRLADDLKTLPAKGDKLFQGGKEVGWSTSAAFSPVFRTNIALAHIRNEAGANETELLLRTKDGDSSARVVELPFKDL
ncbi:MAG: YgfZ/GcvT domain-containing protein, partial [Bryobacteraceae bacterium]